MKKFRQYIEEKKTDYKIYHKTYYSVTDEVFDYVKKNGYEIDRDDFFVKVSTGPKKPSEGKTNRFVVDLLKNGKPVNNRKVHFQVYGMKNSYELNMYIQ